MVMKPHGDKGTETSVETRLYGPLHFVIFLYISEIYSLDTPVVDFLCLLPPNSHLTSLHDGQGEV